MKKESDITVKTVVSDYPLCNNCIGIESNPNVRIGLRRKKRGTCSVCGKRREVVLSKKTTYLAEPVESHSSESEDGEIEIFCPHCHEPIEFLNYSTEVTEYGCYYIESEDRECGDSEGHGDYVYSCQGCEREIENSQVDAWRRVYAARRRQRTFS